MNRPQTRDEMLAALRALKPWLEEQGVTDLRLFGSFARDEAKADSDVDLLCRMTKPLGFEFFSVELELGERLGRRVELSTDRALHPLVACKAEKDLLPV